MDSGQWLLTRSDPSLINAGGDAAPICTTQSRFVGSSSIDYKRE